MGVRELARRVGVTPKAVTDWEKSEVMGTAQLNTIDRALAALGERLMIDSRPLAGSRTHRALERREDRVALELHRAVALKLLDNPEAVLSLVPGNVEKLRGSVQGASALAGVDEWDELAGNEDLGGLVELMIGTDAHAITMRQTSPFLGVLSHDERIAAIARARVEQ
ncbi:hypothetical protein [Galbitalea soli]|uniref:Uncharacterized protein n=1 Tax=Galbitalea soli TaxID=1268042 RepID=A0A7C9TR18_9MICO|nr:hypothetical protein [Galbitalea soli]NEM91856.1 hypothetical protein [Galbitalea soli]NYJ29308.1 transcriptional regulator with XRE-family HTH domain [Galbitalea soli]